MANYVFPHKADALFVLENPKDPAGAEISSGSGSIVWRRAGAAIAGQANPSPVTYNGTLKRFESEISKDAVTSPGEWLQGEVTIDSGGKRYHDILQSQVRNPSDG